MIILIHNFKDNYYSAAVYLRLSKEDSSRWHQNGKVESNSITNQRILVQNFLQSIPNVTVFDYFIDDGYSGADFERPEFKRMREVIYDGKVNMVIVKDFSRFGRDYIESGRYIQKLFPALGVRFISVADKFDSMVATPSDVDLLVPVKNFINDNYCRDISEKVRSHQRVMRENGQYIGAYVAYGYKKSEEDKNKIIVDVYAAGIVKKIFIWKLAGMSEGKIAEKLNVMGTLSPSEYKKREGIHYKTGFKINEKAKWSVTTIKRILTNRIYIGILEQGKRSRRNYKIKQVVENPKEQWVVIEDAHEKIVSNVEFESVQKLLQTDTRIPPNKEVNYLYSGLLYCGDCKNTMVRRIKKYKGKQTIFYICSNDVV